MDSATAGSSAPSKARSETESRNHSRRSEVRPARNEPATSRRPLPAAAAPPHRGCRTITSHVATPTSAQPARSITLACASPCWSMRGRTSTRPIRGRGYHRSRPQPALEQRKAPMKSYEPDGIRNVLLAGHGGPGKTTLLGAVLVATGGLTRMGSVEDGNTVSDHDPEEVRKGISVSLGLAPVESDGVKINVLDAPGYADFVGDLYSAVRAADAVLIVVSAVEGVEVQTEVAWELAVQAGLPRAIFINKLDRERASFERTLDELTKSFGTQIAPVQFPLGEEHSFEGVADLLSQKAYRYDGGAAGTAGEWPDDIAGKADPYRERLSEAVAEADDELLEKYLERGE